MRMYVWYRWGHLAPTCPDTIGCFPYYEQDPFVLDTLPDIFIVGNQVNLLLFFSFFILSKIPVSYQYDKVQYTW
jgi:hypothetical protein